MFPISRFFSPFPQRHYKNSSVCICVCACVCVCVRASPSCALYCRRILLLLLLHPALFFFLAESHRFPQPRNCHPERPDRGSPSSSVPDYDGVCRIYYNNNCRPTTHIYLYYIFMGDIYYSQQYAKSRNDPHIVNNIL